MSHRRIDKYSNDNKIYFLNSNGNKYVKKISRNNIKEIIIYNTISKYYKQIIPKLINYSDECIIIERISNSFENYCFSIKNNSNLLYNIFDELILKVEFIHYLGLIHGDIKFENLMIDEGNIKIIDFEHVDFFGISPDTYKFENITTEYVKPPDETEYVYFEGIKEGYTIHRRSYNYDLFSIGVLLANIVLHNGAGITRNKYVYYNNLFYCGSDTGGIYSAIPKSIIDRIDPRILHLLTTLLEIDSEKRYQIDSSKDIYFTPLPISPIYPKIYRYTEREIQEDLYEIKYIENIKNSYINTIFPNTAGQNKITDDVFNFIKIFSLDTLINSLYWINHSCIDPYIIASIFSTVFDNINENIVFNDIKLCNDMLTIRPIMIYIQYIIIKYSEANIDFETYAIYYIIAWFYNVHELENVRIIDIIDSIYIKWKNNEVPIYLTNIYKKLNELTNLYNKLRFE